MKPPDEDPRWIRAGFDALDAPPIVELWRVAGPVRSERHGAVRSTTGGDWTFGCVELDERAHGGIEATSAVAYAMLQASRGRHGTPHVLRIWNYLDRINAGEADDERYRLFCAGRAAGMGRFAEHELPAATGVGRRDADPRLQVYWLAGRSAGAPLENPRQTSAWRYPRQYGPAPPRFSRAMCVGRTLLISGTASVVGHETLHEGDFGRQFDETVVNLATVLEAAGVQHEPLARPLLLKAYLRHPTDVGAFRERLAARLPRAECITLAADICRRDLLLELDCVATLD